MFESAPKDVYFKLLYGKTEDLRTEDGKPLAVDIPPLQMFAYHLGMMVDDGDICGAEDALFEALEEEKTEELYEIAMDFYERLDGMSDEMLEKARFSREEIDEGVDEINRLFEKPWAESGWKS